MTANIETQDDPGIVRDKLRPDVMLVELTREEQRTYRNNINTNELSPLPSTIENRKRKIWILEGGYCSDTNYAKKYDEKMQQHQVLYRMLSQHGYEVRLLPLPLGYAETMYNSNLSAWHKCCPSQKCHEEASFPCHYMPTQHTERAQIPGTPMQ